MSPLIRTLLFGYAVAGAIGVMGIARADGGEAGLVIQHGDGTTETYCIPFTGDGIRGNELLSRAGVPVEQFSGLVCALGTQPGEGCRAASSFESCTCKCQGADCVYWAFFTQPYGKQWTYAAIGLFGQKAKDGDLQGWKWGKGNASSAPAPAPITFEQVCGHAPRGEGTVTSTPPPQAPDVSTGAGPSASTPASTTEPHMEMAPSSGSETGTPLSAVPFAPATVGSTATPQVAASLADGDDGSASAFIAFAAVALALVAAIAAALVWRSRRGD